MNPTLENDKSKVRWIIVAIAMVLPTIAALLSNVFFPGTPFGNGSYLAVKVFLIAWPFVAIAWILREPLRSCTRTRPKRRGLSIFWSFLAGLAMVGALVSAVLATPISKLLMKNAADIAMGIMDKGVAMNYLAFALTISILHAALEEFFWRWFVYGQLRKLLSRWIAHFVAALAFSAHHFVILGELFPLWPTVIFGLVVAGAGLIWSLLYEKYGSLLGPWISHMMIDLGLMWVGWMALQEVK